MGLHGAKDIELRFSSYVEGLVGVIGHADRAGPLRDYCTGLMMPCERKSVEPMAAVTAPERTAAQHQSLLHFVGQGGWSDAAVLGKALRNWIRRSAPIGDRYARFIFDHAQRRAERIHSRVRRLLLTTDQKIGNLLAFSGEME